MRRLRSTNRNNRVRRAGFSLVEVVMATLLTGLVLVSALQLADRHKSTVIFTQHPEKLVHQRWNFTMGLALGSLEKPAERLQGLQFRKEQRYVWEMRQKQFLVSLELPLTVGFRRDGPEPADPKIFRATTVAQQADLAVRGPNQESVQELRLVVGTKRAGDHLPVRALLALDVDVADELVVKFGVWRGAAEIWDIFRHARFANNA